MTSPCAQYVLWMVSRMVVLEGRYEALLDHLVLRSKKKLAWSCFVKDWIQVGYHFVVKYDQAAGEN